MAVRKTTADAAKSTAKTDAAGRRKKAVAEPTHAAYAEKAIPTRLQEYVEWLERETGYAVDPRSVYLGSALRGTFQKSDENQERIANRADEIVAQREARAQAKIDRAAAKVEREAARAEKAAEREAAKAEKAAAAKAEPKKAPVAKKAPAAKKAATPAAPTRRRPARGAAKVVETNGDF